MIEVLRNLHVTMVAISVAGFALRGLWAWRCPWLLAHRAVRTLPHVVDTLLLLSAIGLLVAYGWNPLDHGWLVAKIGLLFAYIALGMMVLRPRLPAAVRVPAFFAALAVFGWIVAIARAHAFVPFT